jgi:hypothetical protein
MKFTVFWDVAQCSLVIRRKNPEQRHLQAGCWVLPGTILEVLVKPEIWNGFLLIQDHCSMTNKDIKLSKW